MRDFIGDHIHIDGRMIAYRLVTASDYLSAKGMSDDKIEKFQDKRYPVFQLINQIMALKQSCFLLRRTSHSCGSLSDDLYDLKNRLIKELKEVHNYDFDDEFVERDGQPQKYCKICKEPVIIVDGALMHGTYYGPRKLRTNYDHQPLEERKPKP